MIGDTIACENKGCEIVFVKKTHNQRYHDSECTRLATNARIMENYYKERARELGYSRSCDRCNTKLSRYNPTDVCNPCSLLMQAQRNQSVVDMLSSLSFQN